MTANRCFYHGTRIDRRVGDLIEPDPSSAEDYVFLTPDPDAATWAAELSPGGSAARVYTVEPLGDVEDAAQSADWKAPGHPAMSWRSRAALRVTGEVTEWPLYHGTRADLKIGELIRPGFAANFGAAPRTANHVYMSRTLDAAKWGAELSAGEGRGRIYIVEPTGPVEDDPNLTDKKFRGNPTKSFRSREAVRVVGEVVEWEGHSADVVQAMKDGLTKLSQMGKAVIDD